MDSRGHEGRWPLFRPGCPVPATTHPTTNPDIRSGTMTNTEEKRFWRRLETRIAVCLFLAGLFLNYVAEHHSFMPLGVHPPGNDYGNWIDFFLPVVAFWLALMGLVLFLLAFRGRPTIS